jgi:hypothetical protein
MQRHIAFPLILANNRIRAISPWKQPSTQTTPDRPLFIRNCRVVQSTVAHAGCARGTGFGAIALVEEPYYILPDKVNPHHPINRFSFSRLSWYLSQTDPTTDRKEG